MKRALVLIAVALAGCGNWSNDDLEYVNALPNKATLEAQVNGATMQPLTGAGTKQQPLFGDTGPANVGDHSSAFKDTVTAGDNFNNMISFVVDAVTFVESLPPTVRTKNSRVWGPYPDDKHPGFEVRVTITRTDTSHFTYAFEWRPTNGAFFTVISGSVVASGNLEKTNLHRGIGSIALDTKTAFDHFGGMPPGVDSIKIDYDTRTFPTAVEVRADAPADAGTVTIDYALGANNDGKLTFTLDPSVPFEDGGIAEVQAISFWLGNGSGRQDGKVTKGAWTGANGTECWDSSQAVIYQKWWDGTEHGDATKCPAPPF